MRYGKYTTRQIWFLDPCERFWSNPQKCHQEMKYCFLAESDTPKPKIIEQVSIEENTDMQRCLDIGKVKGPIIWLP